MENDKRNLIKSAKDIAEIIKTQRQNLDLINNQLYGNSKYDTVDDVINNVSNIVNTFNNTNNGSLINKLSSYMKKSNEDDRLKFDKIREGIENNHSLSSFQSLLNENYSTISKYEDLMIVTKIMPKLKDVKKALVTSILSPDDFTKQISLSINYNGESLESYKNGDLYSEVLQILKRNEFTKHVKHNVSQSVVLGRYYEAVIPYEKLYKDLLINKERRKRGKELSTSNTPIYNESTKIINNFDNFIDENFNLISNVLENSKTVTKNEIKNNIINIANNIEVINEDCTSLLFNDEILNEDIKKLNINSVLDKFKKDNNISNSVSTDGTMDTIEKKINKENIGLTGCKLKKLDPRRLLKLEIDDTILGYYYIENRDSANIIKNPSLFRFKTSIYNSNNLDGGINAIYQALGDLLISKLDKKFINNNIEIKEELYDILKYADAANNPVKVMYLDPEYVQEYEIDDGESIFEQSLFYAKLYIILLLSNISAKISRSNDVRAYYVQTDPQGGVSPLVNNAINTLKKNNRAFTSMTNLGKVISSFNIFDDLFIPKTEDDRKPIDFDIIQGQDIDLDNEFMEMLEKICVESTGVPLALIETSNEVDFAKSYAVLNIKYMRLVLDLQIDLNPAIEEEAKKILLTEIKDEEKRSIINQLDINLQSPLNLLLTNLLEQINNSRDLAQALTEILVGQNNDDPNASDKVLLELCKKYAPNINWTEFDKLLKSIKIESAKTKDETDDTGTDEEM